MNARGRRGWASAAALVALTVPVTLGGPVAAAGDPAVAVQLPAKKKPQAEDPAAADALRVALAELTPAAPKGTDTLTLRGSLTNPGAEAVESVSVRLRLSTRALANRGEVAEVAAGAAGVRETTPVPGLEVPVSSTLAAGALAPWALTVPVKSLKLPGNGVYVVEVEALGVPLGGKAGPPAPLTTLRTFLPFLPKKKQYDATQVSWLWPLAAEPSRDARGAFTDGTLAAAVAPGGRLAELADAPGSVPVTWMLDPELLESVAALAGRHTVREGRKVRTEAADANAARWLKTISTRLAGKPVAALPYADPDVSGLTRHGAADRIAAALTRSRSTTAALLGRTSDTALAWPPDGLADEATLGALRSAGATAAVLSSSLVTPTAPLTFTPTGRATVAAGGQRMQALLADTGLADALAADLAAPGAAQLATQRVLADTAMLTLERPNQQRTVLVTPPRRWAPPPAWAAGLLGTTGSVPWLKTVGLATMSRTVESPELAGATVAYSPLLRPRELGKPFVTRVRQAAEAAEAVAGVLAQPGTLGPAYQAAALRSASSVWRGDRQRGRGYVDATREALRADAAKVRVIGRSLVTLSSNHGTVPVTVSNGLGQAVHVRLLMQPKVGSRLRITTPGPDTIGPGRKKTFRIEAEASTNGITRVAVQLVSVTGRPFGTPIELRVNTTSYGSLGLVVVGGAVGVLFVAAGVRNFRRIRGVRGSAPGSRRGDGPDDPQDRPPGVAVDETVQA